jgi:glutamine amidotransferase
MTDRPRVGLVDYGTGNYTSVFNALGHVGCEVVPVRTPEEVTEQDRVVLPGVGAFAACMRRLEQGGFVEPLREVCAAGTPFLGICVGMQLLGSIGHEFEDYPGLDIVGGEVSGIDAGDRRLPHIGWNVVDADAQCPLFDGLGPEPAFYFVHSYELRPERGEAVAATAEYGARVTAAVAEDNVFGVQFHPEKSQQAGLRLLRNFATLTTARRAPMAAR